MNPLILLFSPTFCHSILQSKHSSRQFSLKHFQSLLFLECKICFTLYTEAIMYKYLPGDEHKRSKLAAKVTFLKVTEQHTAPSEMPMQINQISRTCCMRCCKEVRIACSFDNINLKYEVPKQVLLCFMMHLMYCHILCIFSVDYTLNSNHG
jgi:hypothetical protein